MSIIGKIFSHISLFYIKSLNSHNVKKYMAKYNKWLRNNGVKVAPYDGVGFIDPTAYLDSADYSKISIARNVTISRDVTLLVHDYSIWTGLIALDKSNEKQRCKFMKPISIGENSFIGARSFILPGTTIGENVIIGAASVVKGNIPSNSVWIGNPARQIMTTEEFAKRHLTKKDFIEF